MRKFATFSAITALAALFALSVLASATKSSKAEQSDRIDAPQLKTIVTNLGYETKELNKEVGKEKYEFTITKNGLDVPIAVELSGTKNYIWFTVFLGEKTPDGPKSVELLKQNQKTQPCHFYIAASGRLYFGIAVENRGVTPPWIRKIIDKLVDDVASTKSFWQS